MNSLPPIIKLALEASSGADYDNHVIAKINDQVVRMAVMTAPYHWHFHPNSDEAFLVVEGGIAVEFEEGTIELRAGEMATVPRGRKHRTRPLGARSVNLTFEAADLKTVPV